MDYKCPGCSQSLRGKNLRTRRLPGERSILPLKIGNICPYCNAALRVNPNPLELKLTSVALVIMLTGFVLSHVFQSGALFLATGALMAAFGTALLVLSRTKFREWPRYALDKRAL